MGTSDFAVVADRLQILHKVELDQSAEWTLNL